MKESSARQSFLGANSDEIFEALSVAIVGLGGAGSHVVQQLSHLGVGNLILVDPDRVELSNLNRLVGATRRDANRARHKTAVAKRVARGVNPDVKVRAYPKAWNELLRELRDVDVIISCIDSYSQRSQLEAFARRYLIPLIDVGMDVHKVEEHFVIAGQVVRSMPGDVCMLCMGLITDDHLAREAYGVAGGRPQVVWPNGVLASIAVGLLVELVTPWYQPDRLSILLRYEGNGQTVNVDNWLSALTTRHCRHYLLSEVGDPHVFWIQTRQK